MFVSERSLHQHMPRLIERHVRRARAPHGQQTARCSPVLRPFVQEDPPRSIRRPAAACVPAN